MARTLIINQGNINSNLGDLAIRESLDSLFRDHKLEYDFAYLTNPGSKMPPLPNEDYFPANRVAKKQNALKAVFFKVFNFFYWGVRNLSIIKSIISQGDYTNVVIGGGQLINASHQNYPHSFAIAIFYWCLVIKRFSRANIFFFGVGVDKGFNKFEMFLYKNALSKAQNIYARDIYSKSQFKIFNSDAVLMPDVAFYKSIEKRENVENLMLYGIYSFKEYDHNYNRENMSKSQYYASHLKKLLEYKEKYTVALFATTNTDYSESLEFISYLKSCNCEVDMADFRSLKGLEELLSQAKLVYSARMHALILAFKAGCICHPNLISQKLVSFDNDYLKNGKISNLKLEVDSAFKEMIGSY